MGKHLKCFFVCDSDRNFKNAWNLHNVDDVLDGGVSLELILQSFELLLAPVDEGLEVGLRLLESLEHNLGPGFGFLEVVDNALGEAIGGRLGQRLQTREGHLQLIGVQFLLGLQEVRAVERHTQLEELVQFAGVRVLCLEQNLLFHLKVASVDGAHIRVV